MERLQRLSPARRATRQRRRRAKTDQLSMNGIYLIESSRSNETEKLCPAGSDSSSKSLILQRRRRGRKRRETHEVKETVRKRARKSRVKRRRNLSGRSQAGPNRSNTTGRSIRICAVLIWKIGRSGLAPSIYHPRPCLFPSLSPLPPPAPCPPPRRHPTRPATTPRPPPAPSSPASPSAEAWRSPVPNVGGARVQLLIDAHCGPEPLPFFSALAPGSSLSKPLRCPHTLPALIQPCNSRCSRAFPCRYVVHAPPIQCCFRELIMMSIQ